jgi:hypothetical protein
MPIAGAAKHRRRRAQQKPSSARVHRRRISQDTWLSFDGGADLNILSTTHDDR